VTISAMNTLRVSNGLPALIEDPIVNAVAQITAETMAANNMSWHIGDVRGRLAASGYGGGATVWATENFAVGHMAIDEIMQVWADPIIMRLAVIPAYCHVGVVARRRWPLLFHLQAAYTPLNPVVNMSLRLGWFHLLAQIRLPWFTAHYSGEDRKPDAEGRIYHTVQAGQFSGRSLLPIKLLSHLEHGTTSPEITV
jgi:hypothetical protein